MGLVDQIIGVESGGNPAASNPNSSAVGLGQFTAPTWLDTISRHRPDLIEGKSPDEILALRTNPDISREMTGALAADNSGLLSRAGVPVTPGSTYLAHFAGAHGAIGLLNADPNAPAASILGAKAVAANPFLQGKTAADVISWADRKMGGAPPMSMAGPAQPASAPSPQSAPQQPQQQPAARAPAAAPSAPASAPVDLNALAAVPALQNLLPARPNILLGRYPTAPFSLRG